VVGWEDIKASLVQEVTPCPSEDELELLDDPHPEAMAVGGDDDGALVRAAPGGLESEGMLII